jgi:spectinomycin phosphotransferase
MLEKPNIPDDLIISRVQEEYDLHVAALTFLPLGADVNSAVYRVDVTDGAAYFLKLRRNFDELLVTVPLFLKSQGIKEILAPLETNSKRGWTDFGEYKLILYPFIEGGNGFELALADQHWRTLGRALKQIHAAALPAEIYQRLQKETFSPQYRESVRSFQQQVERQTYTDSVAIKLAEFMRLKRDEITRLVDRTEQLASTLRSQPVELVLSHGDLHGGNVLLGKNGEFYIVDWDGPMLSQKEHDLMFIGAGFFPNDFVQVWNAPMEEVPFYEGYGETKINLLALAYYRYDRILNDFAAYCEALLLTEAGGADREPSYETFVRNFDPGNTIEIANKTYKLLEKS